MKLRQNGIVSLMIRPAVFLAGGRAYQKIDLKRVMLISIGVVGMGKWEVILGDGSRIFNL